MWEGGGLSWDIPRLAMLWGASGVWGANCEEKRRKIVK